MTASKLLTSIYDVHAGTQFLESISEVANTAYYVFLGEHVPSSDPDNEGVLTNSNEDILKDAYRNMTQGIRVKESDALLMIRNVPYQSNKVFTMYDDQDTTLETSDYFCVVNAASFYHIYKCLDNNMGANSVIEPDFSHISGANTQVYQTSDGYRWKYMYSVSDSIRNKFATSDLFPVVANTEVEGQAVDAVLDIIRVEGTGRGYDNYVTGTFGVTNLKINGNTTLYSISNTIASQSNGFYTGCLLYISSGAGSGSYSTIIDYFVNANGNFIELNSDLQTDPVNGSRFEIFPEVLVGGSGTETVNVVARALVNSLSSNSIYRVEVLDRGAEYEFFSANVVANAVVSVASNAEVRAIIAPFGGHGANVFSEMKATQFCVSVEFSNNEGNTILTDNGFRQIGILLDPLFSDVQLTIANTVGNFLVGEQVFKINPVRIDRDATTNNITHAVTSNNADFSNQVKSGDYIYLASSDGLSHQIVTVNNVVNSSALNITSNGFFACTETYVYVANQSANAYVLSINSSSDAHISNVAGVIQNEDTIIGWATGAKATVDVVSRSGVTKGFNTYVQLYKYTGTLDSGSFEENEVVFQDTLSNANASLHSTSVLAGALTLYTSNQVGSFNMGGANTITGNTSGAVATVSQKHLPELVFGSGKVLYIEKVEDIIDRDTDQSEIIKIILQG